MSLALSLANSTILLPICTFTPNSYNTGQESPPPWNIVELFGIFQNILETSNLKCLNEPVSINNGLPKMKYMYVHCKSEKLTNHIFSGA